MPKLNKLYSINLIAFIWMITKTDPIVQKDALNQVYFLYPDDATITLLINIYRGNKVSVELHDYLNAYRHVRELVRNAKNGNNN